MKRLIAAMLLLVPALAAAQPGSQLDGLSWMVGRWTAALPGERFAEEITTPAAGGTLVSTFRVVQGDQTIVLELVVFRETADGLEMRYRHFDVALKPLEELPSVMRLASREGNTWVFTSADRDQPRRSVLTLKDDGRMHFRAELGDPSNPRIMEITMVRAE